MLKCFVRYVIYLVDLKPWVHKQEISKSLPFYISEGLEGEGVHRHPENYPRSAHGLIDSERRRGHVSRHLAKFIILCIS